MKKQISLLLILLLTGTLLSAQSNKAIQSGNIMLSGDVSGGLDLGSTTYYDEDGNELSSQKANILNITVGIEAGYFIIDGLEVGPALEITYLDSTNDEDGNIYSRSTGLKLGVQAGYFYDLGGSLALYGEIKAFYVLQNTDNSGSKFSANGYEINPEIGVALFLCDNAAVQIGAFFDYMSLLRTDPSPEMTQENINYGLSLGAGIFF